MNPKGSVLLQVMILGIIVAFLSAGMAAMLLMRGSATERLETGNKGSRVDDAALSNLLYYWTANPNADCGKPAGQGGVCIPPAPSLGYAKISGNWCSCSCELGNGTVDVAVVSSAGAWPACQSAVAVTVTYP
ncbi:MAG: hypothetical protein KGI84_10535 [Elusimicrobia bacterium]|nr:hypothetical protein [Elusimicrobiota bacterium]